MVRNHALCGKPCNRFPRSVDSGTLLIAGEQQRNGSRESGSALGGELERGCHESGDRSFHVARSTPMDEALRHSAFERRIGPALLISRRHHIDMARKTEVLPPRSEPREKIVDVRSAGCAEPQLFG